MSFAKCLVLALAAVASVNALATPHAARHTLHHREIAARVAEPRSANTPLDIAARAPSTRRRCRPRPTSSAPALRTSSAVVDVTPVVNAAPKPSSTTDKAPPPPPTTTSKDEPKPTPTPPPAPTPKPADKPPTQVNNGGSGSGGAPNGFLAGTQTGQGTFYDTGLGACGETNSDSDLIAAVSHKLFDSYPGYNGANPNNNPLCGKKIRAHRGGNSVTIRVTDRCAACEMTDLDFSPTAFGILTNEGFGLGRVAITWEWE